MHAMKRDYLVPFINLGHLLDHLVMLVFPTVVIALGRQWDRPYSELLPAFILGYAYMATLARLIRSSMLEVLTQDYVRTARAKGLGERGVVLRHALRNALIPVTTLAGLDFAALLGGAVLTETIFSWPGIGRLTIQAISNRDYYLVQGCILAIGLTYVAVNFLTDVLYSVANPRIRQ